MFGIRTPAKNPANRANKSPPNPTEEAESSTQNVRKSVGEWESGKPASKVTPKVTEAAVNVPLTIKLPSKTTPEKAHRPSLEMVLLSPPAAKSRVAEARICLNKIKAHMTNSKTTKREIKEEVKAQADRLYLLIKESEQEKGRASPPKITTQTKGTQAQAEVDEEKVVSSAEPNMESLKKALEDHSRNLRDNSEKLDRLKEALKTSEEHMEKFSYASVAASQPIKQPPKQTALHSIVVTSTKETETGDEIIDHIRKAVNAKEGWVTVDRIRKAKDRKIVLGCRTEEGRERIKERLASVGELLKVEDVKNRDPLVILRDVLTYNTDEDILKALRNQNRDAFEELKKEDDRVEVLYKKKTRNPHTQHVVLRVSPKLWNRLQDRQTVHIDLQRIRVSDQTPLVQCSLCLGFGHGRRLCKEQVEKCSHCGGPHMRTQCAEWMAGTAPSCCNCVHAKLDNSEHNAFSDECPVRKRCEVLARARVAYC